ncbi:MAG TPA: hypothetical protein DDX19_23545 [Rhodopirellula baltica]|uniref:HAMP domain-containing protein n=2 Tax=Rhodopirellula baltica TaxID=265606 RepID=Q7UNJ3_RHOBA|nr:hypothetical protein-transmembrane prediction [Rhodopirellula baltica SH 1]HBE65674.1 hypothetical protein [Rhodopirellula baltica]
MQPLPSWRLRHISLFVSTQFVRTVCIMSIAASTHPTRKDRSTTVVDRTVQYGVVKKIAFHWIVLFVCNSVALLLWLRLFEQPDLSWQHSFEDCVRRFLPFFLISVALIPAFVLDTLKLTNRFAGPIMRLRTEILNAAEGRPVKRLSFRTNDFWKDVADSFNSMAQRTGLLSDADAEPTGDETSPSSTNA